jgi:ABC-type nitrate/sulfonate/bicarbonate transport system permease component
MELNITIGASERTGRIPSSRRGFASDGRSMHVRRIGLQLLSVLLFVWGWEQMAPHVSGLLFPTFTQTMAALLELVNSPAFWQAMAVSNQALVIGFSSAAILGISLGLWMGRSDLVGQIAAPFLSILLVTPVSALIPLFIIATGIGLATRVIIIFTFAFVIIAITTRGGIRALDPRWVEMATSFGAGERQLWRYILLPGIMPSLITGLRLGLGRAMSGMVAAELLAVAVGVGRLILDFQGNFDAAHVFATVLCVVAQAVVLTEGAKQLERRLCGWRTAVEGR